MRDQFVILSVMGVYGIINPKKKLKKKNSTDFLEIRQNKTFLLLQDALAASDHSIGMKSEMVYLLKNEGFGWS